MSIELPGRQPACAPASSPGVRAYLGPMAAAANSAFANRHVVAHAVPVAAVVVRASLARRVARLTPLGVVKR